MAYENPLPPLPFVWSRGSNHWELQNNFLANSHSPTVPGPESELRVYPFAVPSPEAKGGPRATAVNWAGGHQG